MSSLESCGLASLHEHQLICVLAKTLNPQSLLLDINLLERTVENAVKRIPIREQNFQNVRIGCLWDVIPNHYVGFADFLTKIYLR